MPRRYQPPARRRKSKKHSRPNLPAAAVPVLPEEEVGEPPSVPSPPSSPTIATSPVASSRHVVRDYSYVLGEVRRIAVVVAIIIAGLIVAAATLRWF